MLAKAVLTEDRGDIMLPSRSCMYQVINQDMGKGKMMRGMGFHKWSNYLTKIFLSLEKKIKVASMSKEIVYMYEAFLANEEPPHKKDERTARRETNLNNTQGYIGSITDARKVFEKLYKG